MAGLVVAVGGGCSDNASATAADVSPIEPGDAGKPRPSKPPRSEDGEDAATDEPDTCLDPKPFDATAVPYRPPAVKPGSCSKADIESFDDYLRKHPQTSVEELRSAMTKQSKQCSECIFGAADAEKWSPIVLDSSNAVVNGGGCVSVVSGKDGCGKAYQQWNACLNEACAACTDKAGYDQCANDAQQPTAPCGPASGALLDACGDDVNDYLKECFGAGLGGVVEALCGAPAPGGGAPGKDAGSPFPSMDGGSPFPFIDAGSPFPSMDGGI